MNVPRYIAVTVITTALWLSGCGTIGAATYVAFSFGEAEQILKSPSGAATQVNLLGGITRPIGLVVDLGRKDIILVGEVDDSQPRLNLDDAVTAMRAFFKHERAPLVSIDRTTNTDQTRKQTVRFEGGVKDTQYGKDLLEADLVLKKLGLGLLENKYVGVAAYSALAGRRWLETSEHAARMSHFWFIPSDDSQVVTNTGVVFLDKLGVVAKTEIMAFDNDSNPGQTRDEDGESFANQVTKQIGQCAQQYPAINRLFPLFRLAGLFEGLAALQKSQGQSTPDLKFWLNDFSISPQLTSNQVDLLKSGPLTRSSDGSYFIVDGGIDTSMLLTDWKEGSVTAFRELVLLSRPTNSLCWIVPLDQEPSAPILELLKKAAKSRSNLQSEDDPSMTLRPLIFSSKNDLISSILPLSAGAIPSYGSTFPVKIGPDFSSGTFPFPKTFTFSSAGQDAPQNAALTASMLSSSDKVAIWGSGAAANVFASAAINKIKSDSLFQTAFPVSAFEFNRLAAQFGANTIVKIDQPPPSVPQIPVSTPKPPIPQSEIKPPPQTFPSYPVEPPRSTPAALPDTVAKPPPLMSVIKDQLPQAISASIGSGLGYQPTIQMPHVGGVMLQGAASMSDSNSPLTAGNFSLIFQGGDGAIDIPTLRRFVTALWATYFTDEGPGISIDPIGGFTNRHAVRYIGRVINSDLGRVMRETDYQMKSWAVGTSRPAIPNWFTPEDFAVRNGVAHVGAPSRFWFVPEDMRFSQGDNMLLFESGRMTVQTEYLFGKKGERSQENEDWAEQFTKRYGEIAERYPIYGELFEYAKLVSLAKCLKQHRVPLLWFLLANREMVLTEDSPGTVKAFVTNSAYMEECQIAGGVDLSAPIEPGNFVPDAELLKAIAEARSHATQDRHEKSPLKDQIEIVNTTNRNLTVTPSQTVVISESRSSGDKFATDLGLRVNGRPNLELARYQRVDFPMVTTFGRNWHLMIPYSVRPASDKLVEYGDNRVPSALALHNNLTGFETVLPFQDHFHIGTNAIPVVGYYPDYPETSLNIGLFPLTDTTYRLDDKLGCEFEFDNRGRITHMVLADHIQYLTNSSGGITNAIRAKDYEVRYRYAERKLNWQFYETNSTPVPFRIQAEGTETATVRGGIFPQRLRLFDAAVGSEEIFAFDSTHKLNMVGYLPTDTNISDFSFISIMTDGSYLLKHKSGTEVKFDAGGRFSYIVLDVLEKMIQAPYEVRFEYDLARGQYRIVAARVVDQESGNILYAVNYEYSRDGDLAGASIASAH